MRDVPYLNIRQTTGELTMSTDVFEWNVSYKTNYGSKEETQTKVDEFVNTLQHHLDGYMKNEEEEYSLKEWFPYDLSIDGVYTEEELHRVFEDVVDDYEDDGQIRTNGLTILSDGSISWDTNSEDHRFSDYLLGFVLFGFLGEGDCFLYEDYWNSKRGSKITRSTFSKGGSIQ